MNKREAIALARRDPPAARALAAVLADAALAEERHRDAKSGRKRECPTCGRTCTVLKGGRLWSHNLPLKFLESRASQYYPRPFHAECPGNYRDGTADREEYVARLSAALADWRPR